MVKQIKPDGRSPKVVTFTSGIYSIVHFPTMRRYVGSSQEVEKRLYLHCVLLNRKKHHCKYLQNVWTKYGGDEFKFFLLEECEICDLEIREQFHIDKQSKFGLMNTHPAAGSARGFKHRERTRSKMRKKAWQVANTPEGKLIRSIRAKKQHAEGKLGRKKHLVKTRTCKQCDSTFQVQRDENGYMPQNKLCHLCKGSYVHPSTKRKGIPVNWNENSRRIW